MFDGYLKVAENCEVCGLDLKAKDSGDGPAVFIMMVLGFVVVGLAVWVEVAFSPPYWVHVVLWTPVTIGGSLGLLRPFKGVLVALHYKHHLLEGGGAGSSGP